MGDWESTFKNKGKFFDRPHEDMRKLVSLLNQNKAKKVLDLGCGSGRHTVFLAKNDFNVYGMDNSRTGQKYTRQWLNTLNLKAKLKNASCYEKFPYKDASFDAGISIQVIHHAKIRDIRYCISEIERTLKPNGIIFITVPKTKKNRYRSKVRMIAPRTFIPLDGHETGVPHYQFTKELLRQEFRRFRKLELYTDKNKHQCILGMKRGRQVPDGSIYQPSQNI